MRIEALAVQLRPRPMSEAADLGVRLVQAHARSVWRTFGPVYLVVAALALASAAVSDWLPGLVIFWLKPWLDRTVLFVLSRAVFGTPTRLADVWQAQAAVWWSQLLPTLTVRRLSPWRSYVAPAQQLEGAGGAATRARRLQILNGHQGAALGMHSVFANFEALLILAAFMLQILLAPGQRQTPLWIWIVNGGGASASFVASVVYAVIVLLLEPCYVGAGFAMYLNRRVELEAWDVEQALRAAFRN